MEQEKLTPQQAYKVGDLVDYKVRSLFPNYCELIDDKTDITTYLQGTDKLFLFKGQTVQCRILATSQKHPKIELVNYSAFEQSKDNLTEGKLNKLLDEKVITWNKKEFIKLLLMEEKEKSFESQCHNWIQSLLNKKIDLRIVRIDCTNLLELSDFLNICSYNERDFYQERLTKIIEQLGYYIRAAELLENQAKDDIEDTPQRFIDNLFEKLNVSGFVYHPNKNFNILACLFLRMPELMNNRIKDLLDIICDKDIQIWEREPFSSALIKLLELYIRESEGKIDRTKENKDLIDNNLRALAIQLLLIKDTKDTAIVDYRLNISRLCLLSSYLYPLKPDSLVNAAYYNLFNPKAQLPVYTIDNVKLLPHYIVSTPCGEIDTINSFSQGNGQLFISNSGISLKPAGAKGNLKPVFPNDLALWKNLQVFLPSKTETSLSAVKPNDITPYQSVWTEIETDFFNTSMKPIAVVNNSKKQHRIDEIVKITFIRQDIEDRNKYYCQIEDEIGGNGYIFINDIVGYPIAATSLRHFYAPDGSRLVFQAKIVDKEDDVYHFSMSEDIKSYVSEGYYSEDEDIICSVGGAPNNNGVAPAISKEGVSVSLINASEFDIKRNSIVRCKYIGPEGKGSFHIQCRIESIDSYPFEINTAFKNLMQDCCVDQIPKKEIDEDEEQILESDKLIDESYVREVIYMIDRMALLDKDYVKSFNYLGFARIMCLLIGWESQAAYYKGRMDIIAMLHYFAQNSEIDDEKLAQLENTNAELFSSNPVLCDRFLQLQTISYLNKVEHNDVLFALANTMPSLKELASLVLAYNITKATGLDSSATNIHNKIIQLLNLKGYETGLKLYGTGEETEEAEYKTSIVFYYEDNGSMPNQEKQMDEILKVIDSFFNTRGGVLYIGVNNFGYGVGVENDLKSSLYYGDKDKYSRSIVDAVALKWGNNIATTYIKSIYFDETNTDKDVLIVELLPIPEGLPYHDYWYVRKAGTKRKLSKDEFEEYQRVSRKLQVLQTIDETTTSNSDLETISTTKPLIVTKDDEIKTSRIRENVLEEYLDNYVEPIALFKFLSGGKFRKINNYDYDEASLLTLTVKDSEEKGFLVLGYDNGHIVKVPIEELLEYNINRDYSRNTDYKLIFATIANKNDAILTIAKENKTKPKTIMRLDKLSNIEVERLTGDGEIPYNEGLISKILAYDVIPSKNLPDFKNILDRPKTFAGYPKSDATKDIVNRLHLWGICEI